MQDVYIQYLGNFERSGVLKVHELQNNAAPWTIYMSMSLTELPNTPLGNVNLQTIQAFEALLPEPVVQISGIFRLNKYRIYAKSLYDITNVYAHYGLLRAGGTQFAVIDTVASSNSDYLMQIDFYALDLPIIWQTYKLQLANYPLVQQLSFDISGYENERRVVKDVQHSTSMYPKLLVSASLTNNDLFVVCKDTDGLSASKHIANNLGIAEESISALCNVYMTGLTLQGQVSQRYAMSFANIDSSDDAMHIILPMLEQDVIAVQIDIDYLLNLQTIGETIKLHTGIVLTDSEVANLHPINALELENGIRTGFVVLTMDNEPIIGAKILIAGSTYTTNDNGLVEVLLQPGTYVYQVSYDRILKTLPLTVTIQQVIQIVIDTVLLTMAIDVFGSDAYRLPNIDFNIDGAIATTDSQGTILLRGTEGQIFTVSHTLGQTLHNAAITVSGQDAQIHLYNEFDAEVGLVDEFT